jgi:protocatechuate 3,4-dioxygenase beta subunit
MTLLGASFAASRTLRGSTSPGCVVRPEQTEGPFFVDERLRRSDLRSDPHDGTLRPGKRLDLGFHVSRVGKACSPVEGLLVDVWHCDHEGRYSDVEGQAGHPFLRGFQPTDEYGLARFTTIYPGWYPGRTVHIHFKIRTPPTRRASKEFVSQLYFDDHLTDAVYREPPYLGRGERTVRNAQDRIFQNGGSDLVLDLHPRGEGYVAEFHLALQDV